MKTLFLVAASIALWAHSLSAKPFDELFPEFAAHMEDRELVADLKRLDYKQGEIVIGGGIATLDVDPNRYYYLDPKDSAILLEEFWGNPPGDPTLGMVFPIYGTPAHADIWGAILEFDPIGFVSDEDAQSYDYDKLLKTMQADTRAENVWRRENGFEGIELVGWAAAPRYEQATRSLYWAQELKFEGMEGNTLNFNIRALGRKGVLIVNFVAPIEQLAPVQAAIPDMLGMIAYTDGNRYADFDPSMDKVAAVGIGGLIAGKVLAKTGLLAMALIFLKKFWFLLLLIPVAVRRFIVRSKP